MGAIIFVIVAISTWLIAITAGVRFALTGNMGEAFNFGVIFTHIGKIGWMNYLIALLMVLIALINIAVICLVINTIVPYIGIILFIMVFRLFPRSVLPTIHHPAL